MQNGYLTDLAYHRISMKERMYPRNESSSRLSPLRNTYSNDTYVNARTWLAATNGVSLGIPVYEIAKTN